MSLITTVAQESYMQAKFTIEHGGVVEQSRLVEAIVKLFLDHDFDVEGIVEDYEKKQNIQKENDWRLEDKLDAMEDKAVSDRDERTKEFERNQL